MKVVLRRYYYFFFLFFLWTGCAATPYRPLQLQNAACPEIFPAHSFEAVQEIEIKSAASGKNKFIGAVKVDPASDVIHAVLMSTEGVVLLEAELNEATLRVISVVPPLDKNYFVTNLMADVAFVMLKPKGEPSEKGLNEDGMACCRWRGDSGLLTEAAAAKDGMMRLRHYDAQLRVAKEAWYAPPYKNNMPAKIRMQSFRPVKYSIEIIPLEAE